MSYRYCNQREQRIDEQICLHNLEIGKCQGTLDSCSIKREIPEAEIERRRNHARNLGLARKGTTKKPKDIGDTDTREVI